MTLLVNYYRLRHLILEVYPSRAELAKHDLFVVFYFVTRDMGFVQIWLAPG